jgi:hypothetical protein
MKGLHRQTRRHVTNISFVFVRILSNAVNFVNKLVATSHKIFHTTGNFSSAVFLFHISLFRMARKLIL